MDNENKIISSRDVFLSNDSLPSEVRPSTYNVKEEFSKTKNHKSRLVLFVSIFFAIIVTAGIVGVSLFISREGRNVQVDIKNFEDMNLRDLLDQAKKNQDDLERALRQLKDLETRYTVATKEQENTRDMALRLLENKNLSSSAYENEKQVILNAYTAAIAELDEQYGPLIEEKKVEVGTIQDRITAYDQRLTEQNKQQQDILDAKQKVFELEKQQLTEYYEGRISDLTREKDEALAGSKNYYEDLITLLKTNHKKAVNLLNRQYRKQIADIREAGAYEVSLLEEERDLQRKKGEEELNSELSLLRKNHAREQQILVERYNPPEGSEALEDIADRWADLSYQHDSVTVPDYLTLELSFEKERDVLETLIEEEAVIRDYLISIPFRDSTRRGLDSLVQVDMAKYALWDSLLQKADARFSDKNEMIARQSEALDQLIYGLQTHMELNRENGYIIDPRDPERTALVTDALFSVADGDSAMIFRRDDEYIGRLEFYYSDKRLFGRVTEKVEDIMPFDKLLIEKQKGEE